MVCFKKNSRLMYHCSQKTMVPTAYGALVTKQWRSCVMKRTYYRKQVTWLRSCATCSWVAQLRKVVMSAVASDSCTGVPQWYIRVCCVSVCQYVLVVVPCCRTLCLRNCASIQTDLCLRSCASNNVRVAQLRKHPAVVMLAQLRENLDARAALGAEARVPRRQPVPTPPPGLAQLRNPPSQPGTTAPQAETDASSVYEPLESLYEPPGSVSSGGYVSPACADGLGSLGELVSSDTDGSGDPFSDDAP